MTKYNKEQLNKYLNSNLLIHWWNFGSKTLCFKGSVKEYLEREKITYKVTLRKDTNFEQLFFKVKFSVGSMNYNFTCYSIDDVVRMSINIRLSYLGDKANYTLNNRTRTINF